MPQALFRPLQALLMLAALLPRLAAQDDGKLSLTLLQINDVYEIEALENGTLGGMARVAALKQQALARNPNTLLLHAGDFLNPSVIGTLEHEGVKIAGRQMVEAMNAAGVDLATFGNHEFDLKEPEVLARIAESNFGWVSANVRHVAAGDTAPFTHRGVPIPPTVIKTFTDADGTTARVGFLGVTLPSNPQPFVAYADVEQAALAAYNALKPNVDVVVAITHLNIADDKALAAKLPGLPLFIGGHDHNHMYIKVGRTAIAKADANAKTLYAHTLRIDTRRGKTTLDSDLIALDQGIKPWPATDSVVQRWAGIARASFARMGFDPQAVVTTLRKPLDGRESVLRMQPASMSTMCVNALLAASPGADCAVFNTGSIRIDDLLTGTLTQFDVLRMLPFGGAISVADMKGATLLRVLHVGLVLNIGRGGYLATAKLTYDAKANSATVQGKPLHPDSVYRVAMPAFLLTGKDANLQFLTPANPEILRVEEPASSADPRSDVRTAVIAYLRQQ